LKNIFCQINTNYAIVVHDGHLTLIVVTRKLSLAHSEFFKVVVVFDIMQPMI
jgi:hypothetical protein